VSLGVANEPHVPSAQRVFAGYVNPQLSWMPL